MPDMDEADGAMFAVLLGLLTAASRDSELTAALDANLLELARSTIRDVLERAVRRERSSQVGISALFPT